MEYLVGEFLNVGVYSYQLDVKFIRESSNFGCDASRCIPVAEPQVWDDLIRVRVPDVGTY